MHKLRILHPIPSLLIPHSRHPISLTLSRIRIPRHSCCIRILSAEVDTLPEPARAVEVFL